MTRFAFALLLFAALLPAEEINRPAPELEIKMENGEIVKLSSLKGKPLFLEFFSPTCPHCQKSSAAVEKILRAYSAKGVHVMAIATDESFRPQFAEFRKKFNVTYPIGSVKRDDAYRFFGLSLMQPLYVPTHVFIDRAGVIREQQVGGFPNVNTPEQEEVEIRKRLDGMLKAAPAKTSARPGPTTARR